MKPLEFYLQGFGQIRRKTLVGSRATVRPAPMNTDIDILLLVRDASSFVGYAEEFGWDWGGSFEKEDNTSSFYSIKKWIDGEEVNLVVTDDEEFHKRFLAATSVASRFNLQNKLDRVALFQAVLYGNVVKV